MGVEHSTPGLLLLLFGFLGPVMYFIRRAQKGESIFVRRIAGVDAVNEAIGRSAELGKPVSFSTGLTTVSPILYACLGVLSHVAYRAARFRSKLLVPQYNPEAMAIVEDVVRDAYRDARRISAFDPQSIVFLSESQFAFASGYMGLMHREKVGSAFLFGYFAAESLILAEAGQQVGAMQVAASVSPEQVPFFICTADYTLIGEELYASSAYLSREPIQLGSLAGQDVAKLLFVALILIGTAIATWNNVYPDLSISNLDVFLREPWPNFFQNVTGGAQ
ncbi:MAG: hypothetical protein KDD70_11640 [Bdellovibrionales bacterium]|nr:hypothetical protein [Bdellovibrionales bacterium]